MQLKIPYIVRNALIIVAHPDDETLWAGGTILRNPAWQCFIVCLCRASDPDRAPRYYKALKILMSQGTMGDLDDGPEQTPLDPVLVESAILKLLPSRQFSLILTHDPSGEYTRHIRHEEISAAVINLWYAGKISANELWTFAYEDGDKSYFPRPIPKAAIRHILTEQQRMKKSSIITEIYGFKSSSWEAQTSPAEEAFWQFTNANQAKKWLDSNGGILS